VRPADTDEFLVDLRLSSGVPVSTGMDHEGTRCMTDAVAGKIELRAFTREDLDGAMALFAAEGWQTYTAERQRTFRALAAPGSTSVVAVDDGAVVALIQLQSDGEIQAHLSALVVAEEWRRRGLARRLIREALRRAGGLRIDVITRSVISTCAWVRGRFRVFVSRGRAWDWPTEQPNPPRATARR
jgi:GNAT superfamily N-acetyltransferase